ncbi:hypothetical protein ACWDUL_20990 [Nocardia niigatensis]
MTLPIEASTPQMRAVRDAAAELAYGTPPFGQSWSTFRQQQRDSVMQAAAIIHPDSPAAAASIAAEAITWAQAHIPTTVLNVLMANTDHARRVRAAAGLDIERFGGGPDVDLWPAVVELSSNTVVPAEHLHTASIALGHRAKAAHTEILATVERPQLLATAAPHLWRTADGRWLASPQPGGQQWYLVSTTMTTGLDIGGPYPDRGACEDAILATTLPAVIATSAQHFLGQLRAEIATRATPEHTPQQLKAGDRVSGAHGAGVVINYGADGLSPRIRYDSGKVAQVPSRSLRLLESGAVSLPLVYERPDLGVRFSWDGGLQVMVAGHPGADRFDIREADLTGTELHQATFVPLTESALATECDRWLFDPESILAGVRDFAEHPLTCRSYGPSGGLFVYSYRGGDHIEIHTDDRRLDERFEPIEARIRLADFGFTPADMSYIRVYYMFDDWLANFVSDPANRDRPEVTYTNPQDQTITAWRDGWREAIATTIDYLNATPDQAVHTLLAGTDVPEHLKRDRDTVVGALVDGHRGTTRLFDAYRTALKIVSAAGLPRPGRFASNSDNAADWLMRRTRITEHGTHLEAVPDGSKPPIRVPGPPAEATLQILRSPDHAPRIEPQFRETAATLHDALRADTLPTPLSRAIRGYTPRQICSAIAFLYHRVEDTTLADADAFTAWVSAHAHALHHHITGSLLNQDDGVSAAALSLRPAAGPNALPVVSAGAPAVEGHLEVNAADTGLSPA